MLAVAPSATTASLCVKPVAQFLWFNAGEVLLWSIAEACFCLCNWQEKKRERGFVRTLVISQRASLLYEMSTQLSSKGLNHMAVKFPLWCPGKGLWTTMCNSI